MRLNKSWTLPPPPKMPENVWKSYVAPNQLVPWGYFQDPDDPVVMHPIPRELELLEKAKEYLSQYSYKEVAEWLSKESGREIHPSSLHYRVKNEQRRRKVASQARWYEEKAKEFAKKAEYYENLPGGVGVRDIIHPSDCACSSCARNTNR